MTDQDQIKELQIVNFPEAKVCSFGHQLNLSEELVSNAFEVETVTSKWFWTKEVLNPVPEKIINYEMSDSQFGRLYFQKSGEIEKDVVLRNLL